MAHSTVQTGRAENLALKTMKNSEVYQAAFSKERTVTSKAAFMPIRKLFDIERYLTSFPNFSNEQCEMTLYSLLSRVFPSGQGSF